MSREKTRLAVAGLMVLLATAGWDWANDSLEGPVQVQDVVVVHPPEGMLAGLEEKIFPRGLIGINGSGVLTGAWELDGVAFARFTQIARSGFPLAVSCPSAIPLVSSGPHRLTLRVEFPQDLVSSPITVLALSAEPSPPSLTSAIREGRRGAESGRVLRWIPQPGAAAYEVIISTAPRALPDSRRFRTGETEWALSPQDTAGFNQNPTLWWTVVPWFPGGIPGEPMEWTPLAPERVLELEKTGPRWNLKPRLSGIWAAGTAPGEEDQLRLILGGQVKDQTGPWSWQGSGNLTWLHQFSRPRLSQQESWNALFSGAYEKGSFALRGRVGSFGTEALIGSQFLGTGLPARGLELAWKSGPLRVIAYGNDPENLDGFFSSQRSGRLRVRAALARFDFPQNRGVLGIAGSRAFDPGVRWWGIPSHQGNAAALFGSWTFSPAWSAAWEAARTRSRAGEESSVTGRAWRAKIAGRFGVNQLTMSWWQTGSGFLNPLNSGLLAATVRNRNTLNLNWGWKAGGTSWHVQLNNTESSQARQQGIELGAQKPLGDRGAFQGMASLSHAANTLGSLSLGWNGKTAWGEWSQMWHWESQNGVSETRGAIFTARESSGPRLRWSAIADYSRTNLSSGSSFQTATLTLHPTWKLPAANLMLGSRLTGSWAREDLWRWDLSANWEPQARGPWKWSLEIAGGRSFPTADAHLVFSFGLAFHPGQRLATLSSPRRFATSAPAVPVFTSRSTYRTLPSLPM